MMSDGRMLDFSCHCLGYSARGFWDLFLASGVAASFGEGDAHFIAGMSGYELAYEVLERSGVSARTIQELEQGRKDINRAGIDTLMPLAAALSVSVESLVERVV